MWVKIPGFENYDINESGEIRGWFHEEPYIMKTRVNRYGYKQVCLNRKTVLVHRLVALAFVPNPNNLPTVNHIDHDRTNNHYSNLEWMTFEDNLSDAHGCKIVCVDTGEVFSSIARAAKSINVHPSSLNRALKDGRPCKGVSFDYQRKIYPDHRATQGD